jgi:hypothetical protein
MREVAKIAASSKKRDIGSVRGVRQWDRVYGAVASAPARSVFEG